MSGTTIIELHRKFYSKPFIRELSEVDKKGFACETKNCPCGASLGKEQNGCFPVDVRCEDCAENMGWVDEVKA